MTTAGEVTAFESNRLIELTTYEGAVLPKITHTFRADGDRTIYTRRIRFETSGLLKLLEPLMKRMPRNPNTRTAENLKLVLEGGPAEIGRGTSHSRAFSLAFALTSLRSPGSPVPRLSRSV